MPGGLGKKGFERLREHVEREYEARGIPKEEAEDWARRTAGKVEAEKKEDAREGKTRG